MVSDCLLTAEHVKEIDEFLRLNSGILESLSKRIEGRYPDIGSYYVRQIKDMLEYTLLVDNQYRDRLNSGVARVRTLLDALPTGANASMLSDASKKAFDERASQWTIDMSHAIQRVHDIILKMLKACDIEVKTTFDPDSEEEKQELQKTTSGNCTIIGSPRGSLGDEVKLFCMEEGIRNPPTILQIEPDRVSMQFDVGAVAGHKTAITKTPAGTSIDYEDHFPTRALALKKHLVGKLGATCRMTVGNEPVQTDEEMDEEWSRIEADNKKVGIEFTKQEKRDWYDGQRSRRMSMLARKHDRTMLMCTTKKDVPLVEWNRFEWMTDIDIPFGSHWIGSYYDSISGAGAKTVPHLVACTEELQYLSPDERAEMMNAIIDHNLTGTYMPLLGILKTSGIPVNKDNFFRLVNHLRATGRATGDDPTLKTAAYRTAEDWENAKVTTDELMKQPGDKITDGDEFYYRRGVRSFLEKVGKQLEKEPVANLDFSPVFRGEFERILPSLTKYDDASKVRRAKDIARESPDMFDFVIDGDVAVRKGEPAEILKIVKEADQERRKLDDIQEYIHMGEDKELLKYRNIRGEILDKFGIGKSVELGEKRSLPYGNWIRGSVYEDGGTREYTSDVIVTTDDLRAAADVQRENMRGLWERVMDKELYTTFLVLKATLHQYNHALDALMPGWGMREQPPELRDMFAYFSGGRNLDVPRRPVREVVEEMKRKKEEEAP